MDVDHLRVCVVGFNKKEYVVDWAQQQEARQYPILSHTGRWLASRETAATLHDTQVAQLNCHCKSMPSSAFAAQPPTLSLQQN